MIRGTRRPGGAGRRSSGRRIRGGRGGGEKGCLVLVFIGSGLMLGALASLIYLRVMVG